MKQIKLSKLFFLQLITFGVYTLIWHYKTQSAVREESGSGIMPIGHLMMFLLPVGNIIYYIRWLCVIDKRLKFIGGPKRNDWWLYVLLTFAGPILMFIELMIMWLAPIFVMGMMLYHPILVWFINIIISITSVCLGLLVPVLIQRKINNLGTIQVVEKTKIEQRTDKYSKYF